jgi:dolichol-phosphate mannosyltransferase
MLGVVVPCYNEAETIDELVKEFEKLMKILNFQIIIVNDGSTDPTGDILERLSNRHSWIKVVNHEHNMGLAQSLKDGFAFALKENCSLIAQMDADLTHPPSLLLKMVEELNGADLVVASRYVRKGGMKGVPWWRVMISKAGNRLFRLALRIKTLDVTSGFRMGIREVYEKIVLESDSFGIQLEMTVKAERLGFKVKEIPFVLSNREKGTSKFRLTYLLGYAPLALKLMLKR